MKKARVTLRISEKFVREIERSNGHTDIIASTNECINNFVRSATLRFHYTTRIKFVRVAPYRALITRSLLARLLNLSIFVVGRYFRTASSSFLLFAYAARILGASRHPRSSRGSILFTPSLLLLHLFPLYIPYRFSFFLFFVRARFVSRAREMHNIIS